MNYEAPAIMPMDIYKMFLVRQNGRTTFHRSTGLVCGSVPASVSTDDLVADILAGRYDRQDHTIPIVVVYVMDIGEHGVTILVRVGGPVSLR